MFEIVHRSPTAAVSVADGVVLQCWHGTAQASDVDAALSAHRKALSRAPDGRIRVLVLATRAGALPDDATRRRFAHLASETADEIAAQAIVIAVEGFAASALRSVITAVFALSGRRYNRRVFESMHDASAWLSREICSLSASELEAEVQRLAAARADSAQPA